MNREHDNLLGISVMFVKSIICYGVMDMKGCICHLAKLQLHPFIFKGTIFSVRIQIIQISWLD